MKKGLASLRRQVGTPKKRTRYRQQADDSAIRLSYKLPKLSVGWQPSMYTPRLPNLYPGSTNWRSANLRSAHNLFSQISHPFECGAVRFLVWWLFLHRRLRSGNEVQLTLNRFAPLGGSSSKRCCSFLFEQLEKVSQPSLAEPFGSDLGRNRINSRLSFLSHGRHRTVCHSLNRSRWP